MVVDTGAKIAGCSFCAMKFKKLEHAQRHERTHTLARPYECSDCGKTFARQDTLNRHSRLHARGPTEAKAGKSSKSRKKSISSDQTTSPPLSPKIAKAVPGNASGRINFNQRAPHAASDEALELEAALRKLPSTRRASESGARLSSTFASGRREKPRARATTIASQSAYEILTSVANSHSAITSDGSDSDSSDGDDEDEDEMDYDRTSSDGTSLWGRANDCNRLIFDTDKPEPESEYPSPSATICSPRLTNEPTFFGTETIHDLESILANDPCHLAGAGSIAHVHTEKIQKDEDDFHYQLALSIEGSIPNAPATIEPTIPNLFDELLQAAQRSPVLGHGAAAAREVAEAARYPSPTIGGGRLPLSLPQLNVTTKPVQPAPPVPAAVPLALPITAAKPKPFDFNAAFKEHQRLSQLAKQKSQGSPPLPSAQLGNSSSPHLNISTGMYQSAPSSSLSFSPALGSQTLPSPAPSFSSHAPLHTLPFASSYLPSLSGGGLPSNSLGLSSPATSSLSAFPTPPSQPTSPSLSLPWNATQSAVEERVLLEAYMRRCGAPVQANDPLAAASKPMQHQAMYLPA